MSRDGWLDETVHAKIFQFSLEMDDFCNESGFFCLPFENNAFSPPWRAVNLLMDHLDSFEAVTKLC